MDHDSGFVSTQEAIHKANDISLDSIVGAAGNKRGHSHGPEAFVRCEIAAEDLDCLDRGGICPQRFKVGDECADTLSVISQHVEEIVGIFVFTAEVERQRLENDVGTGAADPYGRVACAPFIVLPERVTSCGPGILDGDRALVLPMDGPGESFPVRESAFEQYQAKFSPDGRWIAYVSNESGTHEVYALDFPDAAGTWQISNEGGVQPQWSGTGSEIFYIAPDERLMAVDVEVSGESELSPDGEYVYYSKRRPVASYKWIDIWKVPVEGGEEVPVLEDQLLETGNWTLWQDTVVYRHWESDRGPGMIDVFDLSTREKRRLISFEPGRFCFGMTVSPDGRWMLYSRGEPRNTDIMLIENFR